VVAKTPQHLIDKAVEQYSSGLSSSEIAANLGIGVATVAAHVRRAGIMRSQAEAKAAQYARKPVKRTPPVEGVIYGVVVGEKRQCAKCGAALPADLDHFYKRSRENGRSYLSSSCKECIKGNSKTFRSENPELVSEMNRRCHDENREKYNANKREKLAADPALRERRRESTRAWRAVNPNYATIYQIAYRSVNAVAVKEADRKRYFEPWRISRAQTKSPRPSAQCRGPLHR
jgi:hypothetical protein